MGLDAWVRHIKSEPLDEMSREQLINFADFFVSKGADEMAEWISANAAQLQGR